MMRVPELVVSFIRLGLILGLALLGAAVVAEFEQPATTNAALNSPASPAVPSTNNIASNMSRADENPPRADHTLIEAAAMMIPAPPETELALQGIDPRRLRASFQRGTAAMQKYVDDEPIVDRSQDERKIEGARLVNAAAVLGYGPARLLIARDYPRSHVIRAALSAEGAVRYSLDPLFASSGTPSEGNRTLTFLAAYFAGRHELGDFALYLMESLRADRRLQTEDRINLLLSQLTPVRGACRAISQAISPMQIPSGGDCSPALQQQMQLFVHVTASTGREAESRRQALLMLYNQHGR